MLKNARFRSGHFAGRIAAAILFLVGPVLLVAQTLDEHCTATLLNRSVQVSPSGTFSFPNLPAEPGLYRVRVTCIQGGQTYRGQSDFIELRPNGITPVGPITFGVVEEVPISLQVLAGKTTFTTRGETSPLIALAFLANGTSRDATSRRHGTTWTSSDPRVATVNTNGVVTAHARGQVIIQARNEGVVATATLSVLIPNDADLDGMSDEFEQAIGLNLNDPTDAGQDLDGDGLTNLQEFQGGTNARLADTDSDGVNDGAEILLGTNPVRADSDGDGIIDGEEILRALNPVAADTDGDGIPDGLELRLALNPVVSNAVTTIQGSVVDTNGSAAGGVTVTLFDVLNTQTDVTGFFTIANVPASLGSISASALLVRAGLVFNGTSAAVAPVINGVTDMGTIQLALDSGNVVGLVLDPLNNPVAGANVTVTAGSDVRVATTDANGNYRVRSMTAGNLIVTARDPNTGLRAFALGQLQQNSSAVVDLTLGPAGSVAGTVYDRDTITPVGPGVSVGLSASGSQNALTDSLGKFRFDFVPLGLFAAEATDTNSNRGRSGGNISATDQVRLSDISFLGRGVVRGVVRDGALNPVQNASVQLNSGSVFGGSASAITDVLGRYALSNIFIGNFNISAVDPVTRFAGHGSGLIESEGQNVTNNITLAGSGSITGLVFRADGTTPVTNVQVVLNPTGRRATTDGLGQFLFGLVPFGTYSLSVTDPTNGDRGQSGGIVVATQDELKSQNLVLNGIGSVTVTVVNGANVAVSGANVTLTSQTVFGGNQSGISQIGGLITFPNVLAGGFSVGATDPATGLSGSTLGGVADGGGASVTVQLQSAGSVLGTVFAADGTTPLSGYTVRINGPVSRQQTSANGGTFRFDVLPTGTYSMEARDVNNRLRARTSGIVVSSQGQEVTRNLTLIGTGTVGGIVRKPDLTPAAGFAVSLQSQVPDYGGGFAAYADINGAYQIGNVPVGSFNASSSGQTGSTQYFGAVSGLILSNSHTATADILLAENVIPVNGNPANPSSISPIVTFYDANNLIYNLTGLGSIQDGSVSVFAGDSVTNRGANILDLVVGGVPARFFGQSSTLGQNGREISIVQAGLGGLDVVRKAFVPTNGYFVRFLDVLTNPTANPITADVRLTSHFRFITKVQGGFTFQRDPRIISTSSGDNVLNVTNVSDRDHWVMVDDDDDGDPFQITTLPAVADVFEGSNATHQVDSTDFNVDFTARFGRLVKQWNSVTIAPGATVAFLHFTTEQVTRSGALASADRLIQLPPEALSGISSNELAAVQNFTPPVGGTSSLPVLPLLTGAVEGNVLSGDGVSPIANAPVRFRSTNLLYGRTFSDTADVNGEFGFAGVINNYGSSMAVPVGGFTLVATHPLTGILSANTPGSFPIGLTLAVQNVVFADSGVLTGTVRRHNNVVVSSGTVRVTGLQLLNALDLNIAANGTYRVNGLPPDTYSLVATAPIPNGSDLTGAASAPVLAGQTNITDINIQPTGVIGGTVRRQNNTVVVNLTVTLRGTNDLSRTAITDTGGRFSFGDVPSGLVTLEAYDPASNTAARNSATVVTDQTATQDLTLIAGGTLTGVVRNTNGVALVGADVTLTTILGTQTTVSGPGGAYQFNTVPIGPVSVVAVNPTTLLRGRASGELGVSGQTLNLDIQLQVSGSVAGTIRRPNGTTPVSGATVHLSSLNTSVSSDLNGGYVFDFVPAGNFTVTASDPVKGETASAPGNIAFNGSAVTVNVTLRPVISIADVTLKEGNIGTTNAEFQVTLSSPSASSVGVSYATASGSAFGVTDFQPKSGSLVYTPGVLTQTVSVAVIGDVNIEPTEYFRVNLSSPVNAIIGQSFADGTIVNDDGFPGQINHFTWANIPSPQYANQPIAVKLTAKDSFGNTLSNFAGPVALDGFATTGSAARRILGDISSVSSGSGGYTLGYSFTPNTNIVVTHVRHYWGTKVSIWTDSGILVASQDVSSTPGTWVETPLAAPVNLTAGVRYRLASYTGGGNYYYRYDGSPSFSDGTIDQSHQAGGDAFPSSGDDGVRWWLVDLKYSVGVTLSTPVAPAVSGPFTDGSWIGNVTVATLTSNMVLRANDNDGHAGLSAGFEVQFRDDVGVSVADTPDPVDSGATLTYSVIVTNTGPSDAAGVVVTNFLPANVTFGSVNATSGSTSVNGRTVTWTVGTLPSGTGLTMTLQVTPTASGVITNLAGVSRTGPDGTTDNNLAVTLTSVLLPSVTIGDINLTEGNVGTKTAIFEVKLSYPSLQTVTVNYASSNGTALATQDYLATNGVVSFTPGETSKPVVVRVIGDVATEPNETFSVHLSAPVASSIGDTQALATLLNDDGLPGQIDRFEWAPVSSPQFVGVSFPVSLTAKDAFGITLSNFNSPVNLFGVAAGVLTNVMLGDLTPSSSSSGNFTLGYSFTPNTNITVTHVRSYSGTKVSIWNDTGTLLASQAVVSTQGTWVETPLAVPLVLQAGTRYRVAMYTGGGNYYYRFDGVNTFPHGTLDQSYQRSSDGFPTSTDGVRWWFVDLKYTTGDGTPIPVSPAVSGSFTNGVWAGNLAVQAGHQEMVLIGDDNDGHRGASGAFAVQYQNDLSLTLADSPDPVGVGASLAYSLVVSNTGPASATNVVVTNFLPASVTFVNATTSQGTTSIAGRTVTATLGILPGGSSATITVNVTPTASGQITNFAGVTRDGADGFAGNNTARQTTTVLLPAVAILDKSAAEGDSGTTDVVFTLELSYPSSQTVTVNYATTNGTALAGNDYNPTNGIVTFFAGQTNKSLIVRARGDTQVEPNETFLVRLTNPGNAILADSEATGLVLNDDGLPGAIDHFDWTVIPSPQYVGQAFPVTVTAKDYYNETVTTYAGPVTLGARPGDSLTNAILGDLIHSSSGSGNFTLGYSFTPNTNITVTHVRSYSGTKVSIWTDSGSLVVAQPVTSAGFWVETALAAPVTLQAGLRYRVAAYTGGIGGNYFFRSDGIQTFANGTIDQGYEVSGDNFPNSSDGQRWWFVDLKYLVGDQTPIPISPTLSGGFTDGIWNGSITVQSPHTNLLLFARASSGHAGNANPIAVLLQNDIGVTVAAGPTPADVRTNLTYSITVSNTGPASASGIRLTNRLPAAINLVSVASSQGTSTSAGGQIVFDLGSLAGGASATATIVVKPVVDGITLSNLSTVVRAEPDNFAGNNSILLSTPVRHLVGGSARVAIYGAEGTASRRTDVRNKLLATGMFTQVDEFAAYSGSGVPVPTLAELQQYDAVLVYSDNNFSDSTAYGNVLADYVDEGGGLVVATFAYISGHLSGRLVNGNYLPFTVASSTSASSLTLIPDDAGHAILEGVNSFNGGGSSYHNNINLAAGATLIAHWSNNRPLVATRVPSNGRVVGLNMFPPSGDSISGGWVSSTDGARLMANALAWASGEGVVVPEDVVLTVKDAPDPVGVGTNVTYTLTVSNTGPSLATGVLVSNVPPANASLLSFVTSQGTVSNANGVLVFGLGNVAAGTSATLTVMVRATNVGTITNVASIVRTEADGYIPNNRVVSTTSVQTPAIRIDDASISEGSSGTTNLLATVRLSVAAAGLVSVNYTTSDSSALAGSDYVATNGTLIFPPGVTTQYVTVVVNGDLLNEADEPFSISLSTPTNAVFADSSATFNIVNDDPLPALTISDAIVTERNQGTTNASFTLSLSAPSGRNVQVGYQTGDNSALATEDYHATNNTVVFVAGETNRTVIVRVIGDTIVESDETFLVNLFSIINASYGDDGQGVGTIINDDGLPGQVDHFDFATVTSPQSVGVPIPVTITAKDALGVTVSNYAGPANLSAGQVTPVADVILGNPTHSSSFGGNYTIGYAFTPSADLTVTHVRSYSGTKVSIWTDSGTLLASEPVTSVNATWVETPLTTPVVLQAGVRYRVGTYSNGGTVYYRFDGVSAFSNGTIHQSYYQSGDGFPVNTDSPRWYFVDLKYLVNGEVPVPVTPVISGTFTDGVWNGSVSLLEPGNNLVLHADDGNGHSGSANPISAVAQNDLAVSISADLDPGDVRSNLTYTVTVTNGGPATSTGVVLTNLLPQTLYFVSVAPSQGSGSAVGQKVTCNLGTLASGATATIQIVTRPNADGDITNSVSVSRSEVEGYLANNNASTIVRVNGPFTFSFKVLSLAATGSLSVETSPVTGDDRGGIALSSEQVFLTGDSSTARFNADNLTGGTALGLRFDSLVSDLKTEQAYVLGEDSIPIGNSGGVVTSLLELDGTTGITNGVEILLSTPINMDGNLGGGGGFGIFSGYGQIVLLNGFRAYLIDLPSGEVTDLGATTTPTHRSSESWAFWGLAENFDDEIHVVYARDSQTIMRTRVPDGATTVLATFSDLSDMASISASVPRNRWYFRHEDNSQFGDWSETLGYADAIFSVSASSGLADDLILKVSDSPRPVAVGGQLTYTLTVSNTGPSVATAVLVSNAPPSGLNVISFNTSQGTASNANGMIIFGLGNVPPGTNVTMTVVVQTETLGFVTSVSTVTRAGPDAYTPNNRVTTRTAVLVPTLTIANLNGGVFEGNAGTTNLPVILQLSAPSPQTISVDFEMFDGSAEDGEDYLGTNGTAVFLPGQTQYTIQVPVLGDIINEEDEDFYVELSNPTNAVLASSETFPEIFNDDPVPGVSIGDATDVEGNTGVSTFEFTVTLSAPSGNYVYVSFATFSDTAQVGTDFKATNNTLTFIPGETNHVIRVTVFGDTAIESNENFFVQLTSASNAGINDNSGMGTIENDDGFAGAIDHFVWSVVASPQEVNTPFSATITAKDAFGTTLAGFAGPVNIMASVPGVVSRTIVNNPAHTSSSTGNYSLGFAFTPARTITVTHVRHYTGTKVSIWTDSGTLLASQNVISTPATWTETPLAVPVVLTGGQRYRVAYYTGGSSGSYYYNFTLPNSFLEGTVDGYATGSGDSFPSSFGVSTTFYLVDLRYEVDAPVPVTLSPVTSGSFTGGSWTGNLTMQMAANNVHLTADDGDGHFGQSASFNVVAGRSLTAPPLVITSLRLVSGNPPALELLISGNPGGKCVIETSTDLLNWSALCTNGFASGQALIIDPVANSASSRFYRARLQP